MKATRSSLGVLLAFGISFAAVTAVTSVAIAAYVACPNHHGTCSGTTNNDDFIQGNGYDNYVAAQPGADTAYAAATGDHLWGDYGADHLHGEGGGDVIYGQQSNDRIWGEGDGDWLEGNDGLDDLISGGSGGDLMFGGPENDAIVATDGEYDAMDGGGGNANDCYIDDGVDDAVNCYRH